MGGLELGRHEKVAPRIAPERHPEHRVGQTLGTVRGHVLRRRLDAVQVKRLGYVGPDLAYQVWRKRSLLASSCRLRLMAVGFGVRAARTIAAGRRRVPRSGECLRKTERSAIADSIMTSVGALISSLMLAKDVPFREVQIRGIADGVEYTTDHLDHIGDLIFPRETAPSKFSQIPFGTLGKV